MPPGIEKLLRFVLPGVLIAACVGIITPLETNPLGGSELWWPVFLHEAWLRGLRFGSDVVFTYGPWGFLSDGYHPATFPWVLAARALIVVTTLGAAWMLWRQRLDQSLVRSSSILLAICVVTSLCGVQTFFLWLPFLLLDAGLRTRPDEPIQALVVLAAIAGFLSLTKFSYFAMFGAVVVIVTIGDFLKRRRPWCGVVWASAIGLGWLASGQALTDAFLWLARSIMIARGYSEAMGLDDPPFGLTTGFYLVPFVGAGLVLVILSAWIVSRRDRQRALLQATGWTVLILFLTKAGFVRADRWHIAPAIGALFVAMIAWVAVHAGRRLAHEDAKRIDWLLAGPIIACALLVNTFGALHRAIPRSLMTAGVNLVELVNPTRFASNMLEIQDADVERERGASRLPDLPGTVDTYPAPMGTIIRSEADYRPRPVLTSYSAYTNGLARLNAEHLDEDPPDTILFEIAPKDGRLPSLEDGSSWASLATHYAANGRFGEHLLLEHRSRPSRVMFEEVASRSFQLGQTVALPPSCSPCFASWDVRKSPFGALISTLYKPSELRIEIEPESGSPETYRFIAAMAEMPILLSPIVRSTDDFEAFVSGGGDDSRVRAWKIEPVSPERARCWKREATVTFYRMVTPRDADGVSAKR